MYLEGIIIFCLAIVHQPVFCYGKDAMADDPILNHLQMDPNTVMGYELLGNDVLHQLNKRDLHGGTPLKVYTMNESIDLLLYPGNSILATAKTPVYLVMKNLSQTGGVEYYQNYQIMLSVGKLLEDPKHLASLVINKNHHNQPTVNGVVRSKRHDANLVIRSLPDSVVQEHLRKRRSTTGSANEHLSQSEHLTNHVIVKVKDDEASKKPREGRELLGRTQIKASSVHHNTKRDIKTDFNGTLYVKVLIHLDSTYFNGTYPSNIGNPRELFQQEDELVRLMEYVLAFWNGVELPYRNLENPTIQFHIAGITIAATPEATPYFASATNSHDGTIHINAALGPAQRFYYQVRDQMPFNTYNLVVAMTKLKRSSSTLGNVKTASLCSDPKEEKQGAVVVMSDNHGFGGIHTARHEVAHAFGLYHDGDLNSSCSGKDHFIMSAVDTGTDKSGFFSPCSVEELREALRAEKFKCLYNPPTLQGSTLPLLAAGKISNMDQQCQARNFTRACKSWTNEFCESLGCYAGTENGRSTCKFFIGAAPGTSCDTGNGGKLGICFMNRCVPGN